MAISRLAVSNPSSGVSTLLYTRVGSRVALASVIATNKLNVDTTIKVWVVPHLQDNNAANHAYVAFNTVLKANDAIETHRFPLEPEDKVYVSATSSDVSFILSGIDNSNIISGSEFTSLQAQITSKANTLLMMGA